MTKQAAKKSQASSTCVLQSKTLLPRSHCGYRGELKSHAHHFFKVGLAALALALALRLQLRHRRLHGALGSQDLFGDVGGTHSAFDIQRPSDPDALIPSQ
jgi:hypothetical protein